MFGSLTKSMAASAATRAEKKRARYLELIEKISLSDDELDELDSLASFLRKSPEYVERERDALPTISGMVATVQQGYAARQAAIAAEIAERESMVATRAAVAELWAKHKEVSIRHLELSAIVMNGYATRTALHALLFQFPDLKPACEAAYWPPTIVRVPPNEPLVKSGTLAELAGGHGPPGVAADAAAAQSAAVAVPDAPAAPEAIPAPATGIPAEGAPRLGRPAWPERTEAR